MAPPTAEKTFKKSYNPYPMVNDIVAEIEVYYDNRDSYTNAERKIINKELTEKLKLAKRNAQKPVL